ncbi:MAG: histidine kinase, partial [Opitutaceae bacterium]
GILRQAVGFGLTLGLWRTYRRWPPVDFKLARHAWQILLCCLVATAADALLTEGIQQMTALAPLPPVVQRGAIIVRLALYVAWSALYFTIRAELESRDHELRLARAEAAAREAELGLLRAQVNPHFLFNALNTIVAEAEGNPAAVGELARAMADYLRYSLRHGTHFALLGDELNAITNYLRVEQAHLGRQRLDWQIDATDEARHSPAPTALVQPLVENAVKYGLRTSPTPLRLRLTAGVRDRQLHVTVENSGTWLERRPGADTRDSTGTGLNNLRRRLALLCGDDARLEITNSAGTVRVDIRLPVLPPAGAETAP